MVLIPFSVQRQGLNPRGLQSQVQRPNDGMNERTAYTLMKSKQQTTRPFWTSTCAGGCAKRQSSSVREQRRRMCSRQTSNVSQRESLPPLQDCGAAGGMGLIDATEDIEDDDVVVDATLGAVRGATNAAALSICDARSVLWTSSLNAHL